MDHFLTFPGVGGWVGGGGWGKIENKDHLSPAEAEIRAELGKSALAELEENLCLVVPCM